MRVLWFTNIPLPAVSRELGCPPHHSGGWMEGLRKALGDHVDDLELGIASISYKDYASFAEEKVRYFNLLPPPLPRRLPHRIERTLYSWKCPLDFPGFLRQCLDVVQTFQPDVIHVHGTESGFGLVQRQTTVPVVFSLQGILTVIAQSFFRGWSLADILHEALTKDFLLGRGILHEYRHMKRAAQREKEIVREGRCFIGRTAWDRGFVSLCNPAATYYHCDEILRAPFYAGQWNPESLSRGVIYCTSGEAPYKGLECLLEAVCLVRSAGCNCHLRLGGAIRGTSVWRWLEKRVQKFGLEKDVTWLGGLTPDEVVAELCSASVYVSPSHIENSPNNLAEAMLVGTPCVASFVGGVPSMVRDGETAALFPAGDAYALAGQISHLLQQRELALTLSSNAGRMASSRHNPGRIALRIMEIYHEIVSRSRKS